MPTRARAVNTPFLYQCAKCGQTVDLRDFNVENRYYPIMAQNQVCYECAYWMHLKDHPIPNSQIIDHVYYSCTPVSSRGELGRLSLYDPKRHYILTNDNEIQCVLLSCYYGIIPERFHNLLPDTAKYIARPTFTKIKKKAGYKCRRIGCYDRYHCFWYNPEEVEPNGPWNEIPKWHQPGWEECPLFINKQST